MVSCVAVILVVVVVLVVVVDNLEQELRSAESCKTATERAFASAQRKLKQLILAVGTALKPA